MSNLYELCCCPNLARQNHRVLTLLPHSLSSTATSPLSDSYREVGDFGIIAVPFDLGIISLYTSTEEYDGPRTAEASRTERPENHLSTRYSTTRSTITTQSTSTVCTGSTVSVLRVLALLLIYSIRIVL